MAKRKELSARQKKILNFIDKFIATNSYPPTIREIGEAVGIASTSVVNYNLNKLVDYGLIERDAKVSRGIQLVNSNSRPLGVRVAEQTNLIQIPLVGKIAASLPVPLPGEDFGYYYDDDDLIDVPQSMLGKVGRDEIFALRVTGDSMIDAMVAEGDIVVLRRQEVAQNGEMVAVWLEERGETTLKRYYHEGPQVRLQPANPLMQPIYVDADQVHIQGRVMAILRTLH